MSAPEPYPPATAAGVVPGTPEWEVLGVLCEMGKYDGYNGDALYDGDWYQFCVTVVARLRKMGDFVVVHEHEEAG